MTPLDNILTRLKGVRESGDGYVARCPAHDDRVPSLSITEATDGRVLLNCHAGCQPEQVLDEVGLTWEDLFPESDSWLSTQPAKRIVKTYDYTDADGTLLFQAVRFEPKSFRQRRPDERDGWIWNLRGVEPVLYRLPEVMDAVRTGRVVFVVEGEKDADALAELSLVATTCPMGASKWKDAYAETLRGARVVILPDNDAPGHEHAEKVARSLDSVAAEVRIVHLPDLPPKGDASDWLAAAGTVDQLKALAQAAPVYDPSDSSETLPTIGVLVSEVERETVQWVWPGRLARGKLTILDGDPGLGKSTLYCDLAARITTGRDWPDGARCERGGVVIVTTEDGIGDTIRPRLEEAGAGLTRCVVVQTVPDLEDPDAPPRVPVIPDDLLLLEHAARRVEARLLVVDPLMAHLGAETNSYRDQDVRRALAPLSEFAERLGLSVLVIRHLNKMTGGSPLHRGGGSIGIIGAARVGLLAGYDPEDEDLVVLACAKNNLARMPDSLAFSIHSSERDAGTPVIRWEGISPLTAWDLCASGRAGPTKQDEAMEWLAEQLADGPRPAAELYDAAEAAGIAKRVLQKARARVARSERVGGIGGGGRWMWSLNASASAKNPAKVPKIPTSTNGHLRNLSGDVSNAEAGGDDHADGSPCPFKRGDPVIAGDEDGIFLEMSETTGRYAVRHSDLYDGVRYYEPECVEPQTPF